jgi:hypothetical protein
MWVRERDGRSRPAHPGRHCVSRACGPKTLREARAQVQQLHDLGTAKDQADERIIGRASLGAGGFVHAALVSGLPSGTAEDVSVYTPHWTFVMSIPTTRLLAGSELRWADQLLAAVTSQ